MLLVTREDEQPLNAGGTKVHNCKLLARLTLDKVISQVFDDEFGLSEDESSGDEDDEGISSYTEQSVKLIFYWQRGTYMQHPTYLLEMGASTGGDGYGGVLVTKKVLTVSGLELCIAVQFVLRV